jgi:hypothetical protein
MCNVFTNDNEMTTTDWKERIAQTWGLSLSLSENTSFNVGRADIRHRPVADMNPLRPAYLGREGPLSLQYRSKLCAALYLHTTQHLQSVAHNYAQRQILTFLLPLT